MSDIKEFVRLFNEAPEDVKTLVEKILIVFQPHLEFPMEHSENTQQVV